MKIGIGTCIDPFFILIYVALGVETCMVVLIEVVFEVFKDYKLFISSC